MLSTPPLLLGEREGGGGGGARGDFFCIFAKLKYTIVSRIIIYFWRKMILISHIYIYILLSDFNVKFHQVANI
jgi:hypothetical protein